MEQQYFHLFMPMYNLLDYSSNYSDKTGSLWFYFKDKATNFNNNISDTNDFMSFMYKAQLLGNTETDGVNGILRITAVFVPLKYLSDFWKSLEMPLINFKVKLRLKWTNHCVLSENGIMMLILTMVFLLSKIEYYVLLQSIYQQKTTKNYRNFLVTDMKN